MHPSTPASLTLEQGTGKLLASALERQRPHQLPLRHGLGRPGDEAVPQAAGEDVLPLRHVRDLLGRRIEIFGRAPRRLTYPS
jgi:hypothetical protein